MPLVPGSLVVVLLGVLAVALFDLDDRGLAIVGPIEPGLPALGLPAGIGLDDYLALAGPAVGVLLVGFAEGLGAAKTYATRPGTTSTPTGSCWASVRPTSAQACRPAWSSTAACPRRR